jgi:hypothetical protein
MGDGDVATPAMDPERGGDVLIAVGGALGTGDEDVAAPTLRRQWQVKRGNGDFPMGAQLSAGNP